jgi:hypothetical protein
VYQVFAEKEVMAGFVSIWTEEAEILWLIGRMRLAPVRVCASLYVPYGGQAGSVGPGFEKMRRVSVDRLPKMVNIHSQASYSSGIAAAKTTLSS